MVVTRVAVLVIAASSRPASSSTTTGRRWRRASVTTTLTTLAAVVLLAADAVVAFGQQTITASVVLRLQVYAGGRCHRDELQSRVQVDGSSNCPSDAEGNRKPEQDR